MARKFTDIDILESLVKQFGDMADASAWDNIRAKLEEAQPQADNSAMDAIADNFIDSNDLADHEITIIRQFVAFMSQQHQ